MLGCIVVGMLAAFGAVCAGWLVYGMLLPRSKGTVLILEDADSRILKRCIWLQEIGLLDCRVAVWHAHLQEQEYAWLKCQGIEIMNASFLETRLGTGAKEHGAGTGDSPGCHQCGGISEL